MSELVIFVWLFMGLVSTYGSWKYLQLMAQRGRSAMPSAAVVIVPIKGFSPHTAAFLESLFRQDHPNFRVMFAVEDLADPACEAIAAAGQGTASSVTLINAGLSENCGQKVWNLTAALRHISLDDDLVVMTDADVMLPANWLSNLDWAVMTEKQEIVTGYRLIMPAKPTLGARILSSINLSVALTPRLTGLTAAWGGTMAMRKSTLEKLNLSLFWKNALSDDLQLTKAARASGVLIHTSRATLLVTPWRGGFGDMLEFGVRQFRILRLNDPLLFLGMLGFLILPIPGAILAVLSAARGEWIGWVSCALALVFAAIRQIIRSKVVNTAARSLWKRDPKQEAFDALGRPLWWPVFCLIGVLGAFGRKIHWAGISYLCKGPIVLALDRSKATRR